MHDAEQFATQLLTALGCRVEAIPESDGKRADLRATDDDSTYLIEVKHKLDDLELCRAGAERMARGEVVSRVACTAHNNRVSAILKHARDQLDGTPGPSDAFHLIWFHVDGIDRDLHWKRAFATFYGRVHLWPKDPLGSDVVECYYFDYSAALLLHSVDAMILSDDHGLQLCLNEFSDNVEGLRRTALCRRFANGKALVDPRKLSANGDILVCRSEIPRNNDANVLNALRAQTGRLFCVIRFSEHSASAMVQPENDG